MIWAWVALAGAAGAMVRASVSLVAERFDRSGGAATTVVNVVGSLVLGAVARRYADGVVGEAVLAVVGVGFCGGLTTFSTWMVEMVRSRLDSGWWPIRRMVESAVVGVLAAVVGWLIAG